MIVRREKEGLVTYLHFGTGNYNPVTARVYTDFGIITCDKNIISDATNLFNALTGHSGKIKYDSLLVSYGKTNVMRDNILGYINEEISQHNLHGDGYIAFKMNQLVDPPIIEALYNASKNGVKIDLQIRGICSLRPGIKGISENIICTSVVGRFLEHTRIYYFKNKGNDILLIGSADMMPRNLDRRVEILVPIKDPYIKEEMLKILRIHLSDNINSRKLLSNGTYSRIESGDKKPCDSQKWMIENRGRWNDNHP
jgi:polyphosphate kinase